MFTRKISLGDVDAETRTAPCTLSSETPVDRGHYLEVLGHGDGDIDLTRSPLPLLISHDSQQLNVGVIEQLRIENRKLRGVARFGASAKAQEIFNDIKAGIVRNLSVGYEHTDEGRPISGRPGTLRFKWRPYECSVVSVPADPNAGFYRSKFSGEIVMNETQTRSEERREIREAREAERTRIAEIEQLGKRFESWGADEAAKSFIANGLSVEDFTRYLQKLSQTPEPKRKETATFIDMTHREVSKYSFRRALLALAQPAEYRDDASLEIEASRAVARQLGREPRGLFIPADVVGHTRAKRDLTVGGGSGGATVTTDVLASEFADVLRNSSLVIRLGATVLAGLRGNAAIPRKTATTIAQWISEGASPTESDVALGQITLQPKTCGAYSEFSRRLLLQSSMDIEALIRNDLAMSIATAIDAAAINGMGAGSEPRGILQHAGIADVAGGPNGLAPTWGHITQLEGLVGNLNAIGTSPGYLTNSKVRAKLKNTQIAASLPMVWPPERLDPEGFSTLSGYRTGVSNNVPSNLTKGTSVGVCSAIIFGNWADLIIGMWGGLDLVVDPYSMSTSGSVRVVAFQDVDIALRREQSFAAMKDALTT